VAFSQVSIMEGMAENSDNVLYEWEAPEFGETGRGWNVWVFVVLLLAAGWMIWTRQWIALAVVGMILAVLYLLKRVQPRKFTHQLTEAGIKVGERIHRYDQLKSFWVVLAGEARVVNLLPKRKWGLMLTLQLGDADVDKVRDILSKFLPEDASRGEDTIDRIGRFFKL